MAKSSLDYDSDLVSDVSISDDEWEPSASDASSKKRKFISSASSSSSSSRSKALSKDKDKGKGKGKGSASEGAAGSVHAPHDFTDEQVMAQVVALIRIMNADAKIKEERRLALLSRNSNSSSPASSSSSSSSSSCCSASTDASTGTAEVVGVAGALEVQQLGAPEVMASIEQLVIAAVQAIINGKSFALSVPSRASSNQTYVAELDRIVLRDQRSERNFTNVMQVRKIAVTTRVMQLVHEVLSKGIHVTKRDLFYTDVKLFKKQDESDAVLDDVACMMGCTRSCLNVVASEKGLVVGRLQFHEDGDLIDCTRIGVGGKAIPPYIDKITNITSDAKFILLVEKDAVFMRLAEDRLYNKFPSIIITGKGQPDVATRMFLRKLKMTLNIPVLAFVDADPHGLKILSVYSSGSKNMSYDSFSLTCPDIKWLGLRPSDFERYHLPDQCLLPMSEKDIKVGQDMLKEDFIQKNPAWIAELELMLKLKVKAEIQALSAFGFQFVSEVYLPRKLHAGDWI